MMRDSDEVHDQALRQVAPRLGAAAADRLDVERTAQAVLARLRAGAAPARSPIHWKQPAWMRAAAVVVVMLGAGVMTYYYIHPTPEPPGIGSTITASTAGAFADFSPGQLQDVLAALNEPVETTPPLVHAGDAGVEDLSGPELQSLLRAMED